MQLIDSGQILGDFISANPSYSLLKTGVVGSDATSARNNLLNYLDANYINPGATGSLGDNTLYINSMPSIWGDIGFSSTSQIAQVVDVGLAIGVSDFTGPTGLPVFSDGKLINQWSNMNAATDGGLFICMSPSNTDSSGSYSLHNYDKGVLFDADFAGRGKLYAFFTYTNEIFFIHTVPSFSAPFGKMPKGGRYIQLTANCESLNVYCLRSKVSIARGYVEDAVGGPAKNCKVFMYKRSTGELLGSSITGLDGKYEMITTALGGDTVFMVCLDDDDAPDFEGLVYDRITV